jgi:hypothetical protein
MEISNRTLAVLLVAAIVLSVGGAMLTVAKLGDLVSILPISGITGFGVTGVVNVSLQPTATLNVSQTYVDFGVGTVTALRTAALLISDNYSTNWTAYGAYAPRPLRVMNVGNVNLSVSVIADKNAATFFGGGTGSSIQFNATNNGTNACSGTIRVAMTEISSSATQYICSELQDAYNQNEVNVYTRLYIPYDAPTGNKTTIWTFNGSQV